MQSFIEISFYIVGAILVFLTVWYVAWQINKIRKIERPTVALAERIDPLGCIGCVLFFVLLFALLIASASVGG